MTIHLHHRRRGDGPTLLMLHGIGSSATAWDAQAQRLGDRFTCVAPDLPGYGESDDLAGSTLDDFAVSVAPLLGDEPAHVVGVSFGALLALALARRYPARVRSLILADATLGRADLDVEAEARWLQGRARIAEDLAGLSRARAAEIASPNAPAEVIDAIAAHMRRARAAGYMTVARVIAATNARPWLGDIAVPTLVLCGEDDTVTGAAMSRTLVESIAGARLRTIPGAGHAPHIEKPDDFAREIREFLQGTTHG